MTKKGTKTKTAKKESAPAPKRMKQLGLGEPYEGKKIAALDEKGDQIVEVEEQIASMQRKKKDLYIETAALVAEHGVKKYRYVGAGGDTFEVSGDTKTTIKVRRVKQAKAKDDE